MFLIIRCRMDLFLLLSNVSPLSLAFPLASTIHQPSRGLHVACRSNMRHGMHSCWFYAPRPSIGVGPALNSSCCILEPFKYCQAVFQHSRGMWRHPVVIWCVLHRFVDTFGKCCSFASEGSRRTWGWRGESGLRGASTCTESCKKLSKQ